MDWTPLRHCCTGSQALMLVLSTPVFKPGSNPNSETQEHPSVIQPVALGNGLDAFTALLYRQPGPHACFVDPGFQAGVKPELRDAGTSERNSAGRPRKWIGRLYGIVVPAARPSCLFCRPRFSSRVQTRTQRRRNIRA